MRGEGNTEHRRKEEKATRPIRGLKPRKNKKGREIKRGTHNIFRKGTLCQTYVRRPKITEV